MLVVVEATWFNGLVQGGRMHMGPYAVWQVDDDADGIDVLQALSTPGQVDMAGMGDEITELLRRLHEAGKARDVTLRTRVVHLCTDTAKHLQTSAKEEQEQEQGNYERNAPPDPSEAPVAADHPGRLGVSVSRCKRQR